MSVAEQLEITHKLSSASRSSANALKEVFHSVKTKTSDCGCVLFEGKTIVDVNTVWSKMCGYQQSEVIGKTMKILHGPNTASRTLDVFHSRLANRESCHAVLINYDKQHRPMNNSLNVWPVGNKHFVSFNVCVRNSVSPSKPCHRKTKSQMSMTELQLEVKNMKFYKKISLNPSELTTRSCKCSYFAYEVFWHLLFYFTGPFSLIILLPTYGHGFAVRHGFFPWFLRKGGIFNISIIQEWSAFFFVTLILFKIWVGESMVSEQNTERYRYFKCFPHADLDIFMPLTFVLLRVFVVSAKYAHLNHRGRQEVKSPVTHENFITFLNGTLLGAWSGMKFNPIVMEHVVKAEIDEAKYLRGLTFSLIKHNFCEERGEGGGEEKKFEMRNPLARRGQKLRDIQLTTIDTRATTIDTRATNVAKSRGETKRRARRSSFFSSVDESDKVLLGRSCAEVEVVDVEVSDALMAICLESGQSINLGILVPLLMCFIPAYIMFILAIKWYFGTLPLQLHDQLTKSWDQQQLATASNNVSYAPVAVDPFVTQIPGFTLPVGCDATDHVLQVLSLVVGSLSTYSLIMFGSVFVIDMRRRKWQLKRYGDIIKFLVLKKSTDALSWLRGRRVLVLIGRVYHSRIAITLLILMGLIVFMVIWSVHSVSQLSAVPQSFYVMSMLSWIIQLIVILGTREGAMANRLPRRNTLAWSEIRANVCEHQDHLRVRQKKRVNYADKHRGQHTKSTTLLEEAAEEGEDRRHNHLPDDIETLNILDKSIDAVVDELRMAGEIGTLRIHSLALTFQLYHTELIIVQALMYLFLHTCGFMRLNGIPK